MIEAGIAIASFFLRKFRFSAFQLLSKFNISTHKSFENSNDEPSILKAKNSIGISHCGKGEVDGRGISFG
jgi:hypothetical protein